MKLEKVNKFLTISISYEDVMKYSSALDNIITQLVDSEDKKALILLSHAFTKILDDTRDY